MKTIKINSEGYVQCVYVDDATIEIEVDDETYDTIKCTPFNSRWKYSDGKFVLEPILENKYLKDRRYRECFRIIDNRSQLWFNNLTAKQKQELDEWYHAWLDVTETKVIPVKPEWL